MITSLAGLRLQSLALHLPATGPWYADAALDEVPATPLQGKTVLKVGDSEWHGTVLSQYSGSFAAVRRVRLVGGSAGWSKIVPAKSHQNDLGVKLSAIAQAVAADCGETLSSSLAFPRTRTAGTTYVRASAPASKALEAILEGVPWWVDAAGITQIGAHPTVTAEVGSYEILAYNATQRTAELSVLTPDAVQVGSVISDARRLSVDLTVRELEYRFSSDSFRVHIWTGESTDCRIPRALRAIVGQLIGSRLLGFYAYRVATPGEKLVLTSAKRVDSLPENLPSVLSMPGVPGIKSTLTAGAEVVVIFLDGDPSQPRVVGYTPPDSAFPSLLALCVAPGLGQLLLGGEAATLGVARQTDPVVAGPFAGTVTLGSLRVKAM